MSIANLVQFFEVPISPGSCIFGAGSIDWHQTQFLTTFWTSSRFICGSTFRTKYNVLSTPMWCIPCNSSSSPIPRQHTGTSSFSTYHCFFIRVSASALFLSDGTNTAFFCSLNSDTNSPSIPNLRFTITSPVPFVRILPLSSNLVPWLNQFLFQFLSIPILWLNWCLSEQHLTWPC